MHRKKGVSTKKKEKKDILWGAEVLRAGGGGAHGTKGNKTSGRIIVSNGTATQGSLPTWKGGRRPDPPKKESALVSSPEDSQMTMHVGGFVNTFFNQGESFGPQLLGGGRSDSWERKKSSRRQSSDGR